MILIILSVAVYMAYNYTKSREAINATPEGYKLSSTGNEFIPRETPEEIGISINDNGFLEHQLDVVLPEAGTPVLLHVNNDGNEQVQIRLLATPDGEWPDDPARPIPSQGSVAFYLDKVGQYVIQNESNPKQQLTILVTK